jgi:hypothetical protein
MMALVAMCIFDPIGEDRSHILQPCLESLAETVDWRRHRLVVANNGVGPKSLRMLQEYVKATIINCGQNIGTARGINKCWQLRANGEPAVKMDCDVLFHDPGWLDKMEEAIGRDPKLGILALKRRDLMESPHNTPGTWSHSRLEMLPHVAGQRWHVIEVVGHAMGTVQLYSPLLLEKIGYLVQMGQYGLDDSLAAARCEAAGFYSAFYSNVDIEHIDPGGTPYQDWKQSYSGQRMRKYDYFRACYLSGQRPVYEGPDTDLDKVRPS